MQIPSAQEEGGRPSSSEGCQKFWKCLPLGMGRRLAKEEENQERCDFSMLESFPHSRSDDRSLWFALRTVL